MTALIVFTVGVAIGWLWQTIRYHRLLTRAWPLLPAPTIANPTPPTSIRELASDWCGCGDRR